MSVVITGLGTVTALGTGASALHRRWTAGEVGIADGAGACRDFDHARLRDGCDPARIGCVVGTGIGGLATLETQLDIDYINAHGTSTGLNDLAEARALELALGPRATEIPISSTKSTLGHLLGAAGAVEAVATVLALRARVAPPNLGYDEADPEIELDVVAGSGRALPEDEELVALSNSFGFGGHNAVLCLASC